MRPVVASDEHKKIECDCLLKEDETKGQRELVIDHGDLAKPTMETNQPAVENQDDKAFCDTNSQLPEGCVAKMSDLGEKLGQIKRSQIHINCCLFQPCVLVCPMSSAQPSSKLKISTQTVPLMDTLLQQLGRTEEGTLPLLLGHSLAMRRHCQCSGGCAVWWRSA